MPLRSLGSNQVLLGGIIWPTALTLRSWATDVGQSERAIAPSP